MNKKPTLNGNVNFRIEKGVIDQCKILNLNVADICRDAIYKAIVRELNAKKK